MNHTTFESQTPSERILGLRAGQMPMKDDSRKITITEYSEADIVNTIKLLRTSNKSLQDKIDLFKTLAELRRKNEELNDQFDVLAKQAMAHPNIIYK